MYNITAFTIRVELNRYEVTFHQHSMDVNGKQVPALEYLVGRLVEANSFADLTVEVSHAVGSLVNKFRGFHILSFMNHESMAVNDQV